MIEEPMQKILVSRNPALTFERAFLDTKSLQQVFVPWVLCIMGRKSLKNIEEPEKLQRNYLHIPNDCLVGC